MTTNRVLAVPPADREWAVAALTLRLALQTDVSDVWSAMSSGQPGFVLVDTRSEAAWKRGHIPDAIHLPTAAIPDMAADSLDRAVPVVTYCWGPGCNGATRAALALAQRGYAVKEMLGGYEYWVREGLPARTDAGATVRRADPLVGLGPDPVDGPRCGC